MKNFLKRLLNNYGYEINKHYPFPDFTDKYIDPLEAFYRTPNGIPFLLKANLSKCSGLRLGFKYNEETTHPYVITLNEYKNDDVDRYKDSYLRKYYSEFSPQSVKELYGVKSKSTKDILDKLSAHNTILPWINTSIEKNFVNLENRTFNENAKNGQNLDLSHGHSYFGPTNDEKGKIEFDRLIINYEQIKKNGYLRNNTSHGDIKAIILTHGDDYHFMIKDGQHRAAILASLDFEHIILRIQAKDMPILVRREDVHHWRHVKSGLYSVEQALNIFDNIFYCKRWEK